MLGFEWRELVIHEEDTIRTILVASLCICTTFYMKIAVVEEIGKENHWITVFI
jgi:hypothetical protein